MFLCPRCHRHVREVLCPFCGTAQTGAPVAGPSAVRIGMKRSAVLAAAAVAAIHCGGSVESRPEPDAAADVLAPVAAYGIATGPVESGAPHDDAGAPNDAAATDAAPTPPDAGVVRDAQTEDVFAPGTDYGIPAFDDSGRP